MKHTIVTFRLHRRGVLLLVVGSVLLGILLFAAGCLAGMRRAGRTQAAAPALANVPPVPAPKPKTPAEKSPEEAYVLRVGTFADEAEAKTFADELTAAGQKPAISLVPTSGGVMLHTVSVGPYPSRDAASEAASGLARKGISAVVVPMAP